MAEKNTSADPNATGSTGAPRKEHNGAYTGWGIAAGWEAVIAYLLGWITGLIVVLSEQECFYAVFHGFQSILWSIFMTIILIICAIVDALVIKPGTGVAILTIVWFISWIVLTLIIMWFAYKHGDDGHCSKIPLLGQMAYAWTQNAFPTNCCGCCCV